MISNEQILGGISKVKKAIRHLSQSVSQEEEHGETQERAPPEEQPPVLHVP